MNNIKLTKTFKSGCLSHSILFEKLIVTYFAKKFPTFYGNLIFNTMFKTAFHRALSWTIWSHYISVHLFLMHVLILFLMCDLM